MKTKPPSTLALMALILSSLSACTIVEALGPPTGIAICVRPIDADDAVLLWGTRDESGRTRSWISKIDSHGRTSWWRPLPGDLAFAEQLSVDADVITVRYARGKREHRQLGVSLDGTYRWDVTLIDVATDDDSFTAASSVGDSPSTIRLGSRLVTLARRTRDQASYVAIDARSGERREFNAALQYPHAFYAVGSKLLATEGSDVEMLDLDSGATKTARVRGFGCVVDDAFIAMNENDELVAFPSGDIGAPRLLGKPVSRYGNVYRLEGCARYKGHLVLFANVAFAQTAIIVLNTDGSTAREISLPLETFPLFSTRVRCSICALGGEVARYLPLFTLARESTNDLVIVDLETASVVSRANKLNLGGGLFHLGPRWFLAINGVLAVLDGPTPTVVAARAHIPFSFSPTFVAGPHIWLTEEKHSAIDRPVVTILDAATLQPVHQGGRVVDATREVRAMFQTQPEN